MGWLGRISGAVAGFLGLPVRSRRRQGRYRAGLSHRCSPRPSPWLPPRGRAVLGQALGSPVRRGGSQLPPLRAWLPVTGVLQPPLRPSPLPSPAGAPWRCRFSRAAAHESLAVSSSSRPDCPGSIPLPKRRKEVTQVSMFLLFVFLAGIPIFWLA